MFLLVSMSPKVSLNYNLSRVISSLIWIKYMLNKTISNLIPQNVQQTCSVLRYSTTISSCSSTLNRIASSSSSSSSFSASSFLEVNITRKVQYYSLMKVKITPSHLFKNNTIVFVLFLLFNLMCLVKRNKIHETLFCLTIHTSHDLQSNLYLVWLTNSFWRRSLGQNQVSIGSPNSFPRSSCLQDFCALARSTSDLLSMCFSRIFALQRLKLSTKTGGAHLKVSSKLKNAIFY